MTSVIKIKRRASGGSAGAPSALASGELAYNEADNKLYYGGGDSGGAATSILAIAGSGAFATSAALALKAPLASPALTGNPTAPTQTAGNNSTRLATTAFVQTALAAIDGGTF